MLTIQRVLQNSAGQMRAAGSQPDPTACREMPWLLRATCCVGLLLLTGCYAPLRSPGIPASSLPDSFRVPTKTHSIDLNFAALTRDVPDSYILGEGDLVNVEIADLVPRIRRLPPTDRESRDEPSPYSYVIDARVSKNGEILLPLIGNVSVKDKTLQQAQETVIEAYSADYLDDPQVAISLVEKSTTRVLVLGHVARPEVYELPKYEDDIAHAIARAGGLLEENADEIQVHRRTHVQSPSRAVLNEPTADAGGPPNDALECHPSVLRIPLRSNPPVFLSPEQATLHSGDVVVVRDLADEAFFVVGKLSSNNLVRFTLGRENRDLGNGFVLPKDRDIDVVTAVAMAGYIDPIDSPTTVTVHRTQPDGTPMLIHVDLIAARFDKKENIMVQGGDIIYLNPDASWWFRRTFDRVIPTIITTPYVESMERWINPRGFD